MDSTQFFDKLLISIIAYQALIFAIILLFYKKENNRSKRILGFYMFLNALYYAFSFCYYNGSYHIFIFQYYVIIPIISLFQPFFYFYIKSLTNPHFKCSKKQLLHFIPAFTFLFLNIILFSQLTYEQKIQLFSFNKTINNIYFNIFYYLHVSGYHLILSIQALIYLILIIKLVYKHRKSIPDNFSSYDGVSLNWLITLLILFFSITILQELFGNIKDISTNVNSRISYNVFMLFTLAFIGIAGIRQKEIYAKVFIPLKNNDIDINELDKNKYQASSLTNEEKLKLSKELKKLLEEEKLFLDNNLRLDDLVVRLNTNRQYLSQIINEVYEQNFYGLINKYRVDEVKKMFFNKQHKQMTIMGIANSVGFNSKSTFNTLFKKYTNKTPSQFIKENNL